MGFSAVAASLGSKSFLDLTVDQYLWGYEDKLVTVANQFLPNWIDFGTFGLLERVRILFTNSRSKQLSFVIKALNLYFVQSCHQKPFKEFINNSDESL